MPILTANWSTSLNDVPGHITWLKMNSTPRYDSRKTRVLFPSESYAGIT
jgi:hypothetical protein